MTEKTKLEILKASALARELNDKECEVLSGLMGIWLQPYSCRHLL